MKKLPLLFSGAIALSIAMFPVLSRAQQEQTGQDPVLAGIDLTTEQKQKLKQLRDNTKSQVEAILTSEQQDKLKATMEHQGKQQPQNVFATLSLSQEQKEKLQDIFQSAHQQEFDIFTPEQQEQIRQSMPFPPDSHSITEESKGS